ncbi:hypothetical protein ZIOFF_051292 [Zingiber officinale]|uniref:Uncharacterized protein n=1 Tax=Zingiber officinale TaxID=94328 RepID=A0A8J5FSF8_ZINOF|nr:hypothetical protein ZIOFF_051292 [Zingiber officinale]
MAGKGLFIFDMVLAAVVLEVLSKSKHQSCARGSEYDNLNCEKKIVLNLAVPSGSVAPNSARLLRYERSISTELNHVDEPHKLEEVETIRKPPPPLEKLYWVAMVSLVHLFTKRLWIKKGYQSGRSSIREQWADKVEWCQGSLLEILVTFVVVQKHIHTRLFANNHDDHRFVDKSGNILPG